MQRELGTDAESILFMRTLCPMFLRDSLAVERRKFSSGEFRRGAERGYSTEVGTKILSLLVPSTSHLNPNSPGGSLSLVLAWFMRELPCHL